MVKRITWKHVAGATIGASAGASAGMGIGTFMIGQALTAPISFPISGGIAGFFIGKNKPLKTRLKIGAIYSTFAFLGSPVSAPMHIVLAPIAAVGVTTMGTVAGILLVEKAIKEGSYAL